MLAEYLGVTTSELLGEEAAPAADPDKGSIMAAFWGGDQDLTDEDKEAMWADVKNFAAFVAQQKRQEKQRND